MRVSSLAPKHHVRLFLMRSNVVLLTGVLYVLIMKDISEATLVVFVHILIKQQAEHRLDIT